MSTKHNDSLISADELAQEVSVRDWWGLTDEQIAIKLTSDRSESIKTLAFCPEDIQKARKVHDGAPIHH